MEGGLRLVAVPRRVANSHVTGSVKYRKGQEACYLMRVRLTHKIRNAS